MLKNTARACILNLDETWDFFEDFRENSRKPIPGTSCKLTKTQGDLEITRESSREFEEARRHLRNIRALLIRERLMKTETIFQSTFKRTFQENHLGFNVTPHHVTLVHFTPTMDIIRFMLCPMWFGIAWDTPGRHC